MKKLFTPSKYCRSQKTLVTMHWTHLRLNGICTTSFYRPKTKRCSLWVLLAVMLPYLMFINDATVTDQNKIHTSYSELNYLQNVYFGIFRFWKLTRCRFVTYLWNKPRTFDDQIQLWRPACAHCKFDAANTIMQPNPANVLLVFHAESFQQVDGNTD